METWLFLQMLLPLQASPSRIAISSTTHRCLCREAGMAFSMLPDTACPLGARVSIPPSPCLLQDPATSCLAAHSVPSPVVTLGALVICLPGLGWLSCSWCRSPPLNRSPHGHDQGLVGSLHGSTASIHSDLAFSSLHLFLICGAPSRLQPCRHLVLPARSPCQPALSSPISV